MSCDYTCIASDWGLLALTFKKNAVLKLGLSLWLAFLSACKSVCRILHQDPCRTENINSTNVTLFSGSSQTGLFV